jgi:hypothetical protein
MECSYRYCSKEINYGRPDRKFCNKNCRLKENTIIREIKSLNIKSKRGKDFIVRSEAKHNSRYKYDLVIYKNTRTKVQIICPVHGIFEQTPNLHMTKYGICPNCVLDKKRLKFIKQGENKF